MEKSNQMKNLLILILLFTLFSCGTRKTELEKTDNIKVENTYQEGSKIVLGNTFTYKPFDNLKPMVIEGKTYNNTIISNDKSKIIEKWKNKYITKTITIEKKKTTERSDNTMLWVLIALIVCGFVFLWFYLPKLKV